jgi:hypothetical protein
MTMLRVLLLILASCANLAPSIAGAGEPQEGVPQLSDDDDDAESARPAWADPNAEPPPLAVDDDPTPFDPAERPPDPDPE